MYFIPGRLRGQFVELPSDLGVVGEFARGLGIAIIRLELAELGRRREPGERAEQIDEEPAGEVVGLVLDGAAEEVVGLDLDEVAVEVEGLGPDLPGRWTLA